MASWAARARPTIAAIWLETSGKVFVSLMGPMLAAGGVGRTDLSGRRFGTGFAPAGPRRAPRPARPFRQPSLLGTDLPREDRKDAPWMSGMSPTRWSAGGSSSTG